jgi:hypothetical protein
MFKKLMLGTVALISTIGVALAISGNQIGFPIVGGASYCGSFGNGGVCNQTVPAGPTIVTGNETIIANTNLPNGQNPQTVLLNMASIGAGPYQYVAITASGGSSTILSTTSAFILDPTGTTAAYTLVLPADAVLSDNQRLKISSSQTVTSLTLTPGAGTTVSNSPTALTISTTAAYGYEFIYDKPLTKWYRLQ